MTFRNRPLPWNSLRRQVDNELAYVNRVFSLPPSYPPQVVPWIVAFTVLLAVPIVLPLPLSPFDPKVMYGWVGQVWPVQTALLALVVTLVAFIIGLGLRDPDRATELRHFRSSGFDFLVVAGTFSVALAGTLLLVAPKRISPLWQDEALILLGMTALTLVALLVFVTNLVSRITLGRLGIPDDVALVQVAQRFIKDQARIALSKRILKDWCNQHEVRWYDSSPLIWHTPTADDHFESLYQTGVIEDVDLRWLERWRTQAAHRGGTDVHLVLYLGLFGRSGDTVAIVSNGNRSSLQLSKGLYFRNRSKNDLRLRITELRDRLVESSRGDNMQRFEADLDLLEVIFESVVSAADLVESRSGIHIDIDWVFSYVLSARIYDITARVVERAPRSLYGSWIYFPLRLLKVARRTHSTGVAQSAFAVWFSVLRTVQPHEELSTQLWRAIDQHVREVAFEFGSTKPQSQDRLRLVSHVTTQVLWLAQQLLLFRVPAVHEHIEQWLTQLGDYPELQVSLETFWLGYSGWMVNEYIDKRVSLAEMTTHFRRLSAVFQSLADLWSRWRAFYGDLSWSTLQFTEADAPQSGFIDPYAGTQYVLALLATSLISEGQALPPDYEACGLLTTTLANVLNTFEQDPEAWTRVVSLSPSTWPELLHELREQLKTSQHMAEASRNAAIARTSLSLAKLEAFVKDELQDASMGLFSRLDSDGAVTWIDAAPTYVETLRAEAFPRASFIDSADAMSLPPRMGFSFLAREDLQILTPLWRLPAVLSSSHSDVFKALRREMDRLVARGTPPSHIFVSTHEWRFIQRLREEESFEPRSEGPRLWLLGYWNKIPVHTVPGHPHDRVILASLAATLQLSVWTGNATHGRFQVLFEEPSAVDDSVQHLSSQCGIPFEGQDLETAQKCILLYSVQESLEILLADPCASSVLKIPHTA